MKFKKVLIFILVPVLIFILAMVIFITSFNEGKEPIKLETPVLTLESDTVKWDMIENASKYELDIDDVCIFVESEILSYKLEVGETVRVRAIGSDGYTDSDWSNKVSYTLSKYTVIWKCDDNILEVDLDVLEGSSPQYNKEVPFKESDNYYNYIFTGWFPELTTVSGNVTYEAQFEKKERLYTVNFYSEDGNVLLDTEKVTYGSSVTFNKELPVKTAPGKEYEFAGWVLDFTSDSLFDLTNITESVDLYAYFIEITPKVDVTISTYNDYGSIDVSILKGVTIGSLIEVKDNKLCIDSLVVTAIPNENTAQYTYGFAGWIYPSVVAEDTIVYAVFTRKVNTYKVTWKYGNTTLQEDTLDYGVIPTYKGVIPEKEGFVFCGWSPKVSAVVANVTYEAVFTNAIEVYNVVFYDYDKNVLAVETVFSGQDCNAPIAPEKEGYRFVGWDTDLTNVNRNLEVNAIYVKQYEVIVYDYDQTILEVLLVDENSIAVPTITPNRRGYKFTGWDTVLTNITSDLNVTATYVKLYNVVFVDYDNKVLLNLEVEKGKDAIYSGEITREGYRFVGWDTDLTNITNDMYVYAIYEINKYTVTFVNPNGEIVSVIENVKHGSNITLPTVEDIYFDWDVEMKAYSFTGFSHDGLNITQDLTVNVLYDKEYDGLLFILETIESSRGTTHEEVRLYICGNEKIQGIFININFEKELVVGDNSSVKVNNGLTGYEGKLDNNKNNYELSWVDSNGLEVKDYFQALMFMFELDKKIAVGEYFVEIISNSYYINEDFEKVTPVIISGGVIVE